MKTIKIMSVLMLSAVLTACGGGVGTEPSAYTAKSTQLRVTTIATKLLDHSLQEMNVLLKQ